MKELIFLLACLLMAGLVGCADRNEEGQSSGSSNPDLEPPRLTVKVEEKEIRAVRGSYSWSAEGKGVDASGAPPEELLVEQTGERVQEKAPVEFQFSQDPISFEVNERKMSGESVPVELPLNVPEQGTAITYEVIAEFGDGTVTYGFKLQPIDEKGSN